MADEFNPFSSAGPGSVSDIVLRERQNQIPELKLGISQLFRPELSDRFNFSFTQTAVDFLTLQQAKRQEAPTLSPEELRELGIKSDKPLNRFEAVYRSFIKAREDKRDSIQGLVNNEALGSTVVPFVRSVVGNATDPVTSTLFGFLEAGGLVAGQALLESQLLRSLGRAGAQVERFVRSESILGQAAKGGLEGALESGIEVPFEALAAEQASREFTGEDAVYSLLANITFGVGIRGGLTALSNRLNSPRKDFTGKEAEVVTDLAEYDTSRGRAPNYENYKGYTESRRNTLRDGSSDYVYSPIEVGTVKDNTFYASVTPQSGGVGPDSIGLQGRSYGRGIVLTDNQNLASATASKSVDLSSGKVLAVSIDESLFDLKQPLPDGIKEKLNKELKTILDQDEIDDILRKGTTKEALDELEAIAHAENSIEVQEIANEAFRSEGFRGYKYENTSNGQRNNSLFIFDPEDLQVKSANDAPFDSRAAEKPSTETNESAQKLLEYNGDAKSDLDYHEVHEEFTANGILDQDTPPDVEIANRAREIDEEIAAMEAEIANFESTIDKFSELEKRGKEAEQDILIERTIFPEIGEEGLPPRPISRHDFQRVGEEGLVSTNSITSSIDLNEQWAVPRANEVTAFELSAMTPLKVGGKEYFLDHLTGGGFNEHLIVYQRDTSGFVNRFLSADEIQMEEVGTMTWNKQGIRHLVFENSKSYPSALPAKAIRHAVEVLGAPPAVSGSISAKAARLANLLYEKQRRTALRAFEKAHKKTRDIELAENRRADIFREAAKATEFCKRNS